MPGIINLTFGCLNPTGTLYTARLDFSTSNICTTFTQTVYTSGGWGIGIIIYSDAALTTPVTGYNFVVDTIDSVIYEINNSTGEIQSNTGNMC